MSRARHMSAQTEILQKYFEELRRTLVDNDLIDRPGQIFNMDECGFPHDPKSSFVACKKGEKHPMFVTTGGKLITVAACCNASGYSIPPLVIFDRKILKTELTIGEVPETMYAALTMKFSNSDSSDSVKY
uniref:DDE-1 domain-containing protein n=1 Tax=Amphimedon queenslandica TaxID=400682 RepID=A0A1X7U1W5_AMPQE